MSCVQCAVILEHLCSQIQLGVHWSSWLSRSKFSLRTVRVFIVKAWFCFRVFFIGSPYTQQRLWRIMKTNYNPPRSFVIATLAGSFLMGPLIMFRRSNNVLSLTVLFFFVFFHSANWVFPYQNREGFLFERSKRKRGRRKTSVSERPTWG